MRTAAALSLGASFLALACAEDQYIYRPAEQATATMNGLPAGRYAVPPEKPLGTVVVASPGIVEMEFPNDAKAQMLSLRMVVTNNGDDTPWSVDTREQRAILIGGGESRPAYVNTDGGSPPVLHIARGEKQTVDLYFPLPSELRKPDRLPEFDFAWEVQTSERLVAERTPFDRLEVQPTAPAAHPYYYGWGLGPYWWYDPLWPGPSYVLAPSFRYYPGPPVHVRPVVPPTAGPELRRPDGPMNPAPPRVAPAPNVAPGRTSPPPVESPRTLPPPPAFTAPHRPNR